MMVAITKNLDQKINFSTARYLNPYHHDMQFGGFIRELQPPLMD